MTPITSIRLLATALVAMVTLAAGSAAAAGGPIISAGTGCALQCIEKALVVPTSTSATVEIETTVLAHLTVSVTKQAAGTTTGGLVAVSTKTVHISAFSQNRTASFLGLEPDTTYSISVKATDLKQQTASRKGSFETLPVKTNGYAGPTTFDSGLGCAAQCIEQALFSQTRPAASIAKLDVRTATDAKISVVVSRDKPVATAAGPSQLQIVSKQSSPGMTRSWQTQVGGLLAGTRYWAVVRAKDAQGRTSIRQGSFRTVSASAIVTLHKIKVLNDGDKGRNKGELYFRYYGGGEELASNGTFQKIRSVSVVGVKVYGQGRPGFSMVLPANGDAKLDVRVLAEECDNVLKKNCLVEAGGPSVNQYAYAGGTFDLSSILAGGALPPWYGTGVAPPAGHDGYFVLSTKDTYIEFLVLATVDIRIDWP
ncbi:MAG: hypothetical protein ACRDNB_06780 [Gaiellaceae bacterium]